MVNFLGVVVQPSEVKANPVRTTGKATQQERDPNEAKTGSTAAEPTFKQTTMHHVLEP